MKLKRLPFNRVSLLTTVSVAFFLTNPAFGQQCNCKPQHIRLPSPITSSDYYNNGEVVNSTKIELGRLLFFDKLLSGNKNISCATCHHPQAGTGDDLSLPVGEGANGLGRDRNLGIGGNAVHQRVPRNSPPIFNLGAKEFKTMFHDGRLQAKFGRFETPIDSQIPSGLDNVLAVQAMLPVTSDHEMAGQHNENDVAIAAAKKRFSGSGGVWDILAKRIRHYPAYVEMFKDAYPGRVRYAGDIKFLHAANAIAAFEAFAFRTDNSPFDEYQRGNTHAMSDAAHRGMYHFYGKAKCATCHSGKFQTDHSFHAIAMPQIGPGKGHGYRKLEDYGRGAVTKKTSDRYKFRTPTLRNVAVTGPWGHSGAYSSLEEVVRHHLNPEKMLHQYSTDSTYFPYRSDLDRTDSVVQNHSTSRFAIARANELSPVYLTSTEVSELVAFLHALTDPRAAHPNASMVPTSVPSGLPVTDYVNFPEPGHHH